MSIFTLPRLPYATTALEPHISAETLTFHHGKHHQGYVNKLNALWDDSDLKSTLKSASLDEVIRTSDADSQYHDLYQQAAQVWNHTFYWNCLSPNGGGQPVGELAQCIESDFGSYEKFREEFKTVAVSQFGSGWAWLVADEFRGKLSIMSTANADTPMSHGKVAVLTCDVWEHAYYVDYRNRRHDYVDVFLDHLLNWDYALAKYHGESAGIES